MISYSDGVGQLQGCITYVYMHRSRQLNGFVAPCLYRFSIRIFCSFRQVKARMCANGPGACLCVRAHMRMSCWGPTVQQAFFKRAKYGGIVTLTAAVIDQSLLLNIVATAMVG